MALHWCIHYEDGSTYSSEDGPFGDAPAFGVLAVVCDEGEMVLGGDLAGLIDYLARAGIVKFGRMTDNRTYRRIMDPVRKEPYPQLGFARVVNEGCDFYWWMGDRQWPLR